VSLLDLSRLTYAYPESTLPALDQVDLELDSGLVVLVGPSGGGKSTLLRVCNGLVPHFHGGTIRGRARVLGRDVARTPTRELAREVGFVFQDPEMQAAYPSVDSDVAFGLENLAIPAREMRRRVDEALAACGISHLRSRAVSTLSGGERQRVALAGVLAMQPRLLVLDEPLSQLDPEGSRSLLGALDAVVKAGTAVLIAEHRDSMLRGRPGRALRIAAGALTEAGPRHAGEQGGEPAVAEGSIAHAEPRRGRSAPGWELSGVAAGHGGDAVLHDLDLAAGPGEVVVLSGANGSGKTTLLRIIAGLLPPLHGSVSRSPGRVAYLPQNPAALLFRATVRDEVRWTLRRSRSPEPPEDVLHSLGLGPLAGRFPGDLSSGERQRAALAAVLAGSPPLALLDEPTRGMDAPSRAALVAAVGRIRARGGSVVLATHDSALAAEVATRVIRLSGGCAREVRLAAAAPC
jgi:energy-coupling factor transporter ATP-binding protein EcfA2